MKLSLWQLGFRPFFLFGSAYVLLAILIWVVFLSGGLTRLGALDPLLWHPHEMIYGFTTAIVGGFVLTAAQNWSGKPGVKGWPLQLIVFLWIAARILLLFPDSPQVLAAAVDLSFCPLLGLLMWPYLKDPELKTERVFYLFFTLLFAGNFLVHLEALGWLVGYARKGIYLGLNTILLIIIFIGGRVIPFFTESSIARRQPVTRMPVEVLSFAAAGAYLVTDFVASGSRLHAVFAFAAAAVHFIRLLGWQVRRVRRVPLIWVLHLGYLWMVLGFALAGLASLGLFAQTLAVHAFTVGGLGVIIYGMISRVSLGHTGRRLHPSAWTVAGYVFLNVSAAIRVFFPLLFPSLYMTTLTVSGICWAIAFALFLVVYTPVLLKPRVDGRPG